MIKKFEGEDISIFDQIQISIYQWLIDYQIPWIVIARQPKVHNWSLFETDHLWWFTWVPKYHFLSNIIWNFWEVRKISCWIFEYLTKFWAAATLELKLPPAGNHQRAPLLYLSSTFPSNLNFFLYFFNFSS